MKKWYSSVLLLVVSILFSFPVWADVNLEPLLNKVILQLQAEQWVTTKTALLTVGVNAAVTDQGIDKVQTDVMQKLNQLSNKGEWHIVSFDRQQDKSGLESIQISAQARLPQSELSNLRDKAKAISKPGETFTIDNVQFTPSDDELRQAAISLRNTIYQQAKAEIDALNKVYTDQKYYLHQIDFTLPPPIMPMAENTMAMARVSGGMSRSAPPLLIGNKQALQASVILAAMPDQVAQKLMTHN
jgi:hypothetical protein